MKNTQLYLSIFVFAAFFMMSFVALTIAPRLYYKDAKIMERYVELQYEITNPGYVELHLTNREGKKVWIKGKVHDKSGDQYFRIPRKPLKADERYTFVLKYKGRDYSGSFYNQ